jgi:hypothetical protein
MPMPFADNYPAPAHNPRIGYGTKMPLSPPKGTKLTWKKWPIFEDFTPILASNCPESLSFCT